VPPQEQRIAELKKLNQALEKRDTPHSVGEKPPVKKPLANEE
jgi:hypothetical protein